MAADARQILIVAAAVRQAIAAALDQAVPIETAIAIAAAKILGGEGDDDAGPAERPAEKRRRQNADAMLQLAALELEGKGRGAASIVARRMAADPRDPAEVEAMAQHLRRIRRRQAKRALRARAPPARIG
jgi:hypothetical protein